MQAMLESKRLAELDEQKRYKEMELEMANQAKIKA
jgi:hypothetical protein